MSTSAPVNLMSAYRLAVAAGVSLPPAVTAPPVPQRFIDQVAARETRYPAAQALAAAVGGVIMYDSVNPGAIPLTAVLVASYVDGYGGYPAAVARFGAAKCVSISVGGSDADVADVEPGAMTAAQLPGWVARQQARGIARPALYSDQSQYASVLAAGGSGCAYWTATDSRQAGQVLSGRDAVQYDFAGSYDLSWCLPSWPWYPGSTAPVPPPATAWPLTVGSTGADVVLLQDALNAAKFASPPLSPDGNFGPLTLAAVRAAQAALSVPVTGQVTQAFLTVLQALKPPVVPPPVPPPPLARAIAGLTVTYTDGTSQKLP